MENPADRTPAALEADLREQYVSREYVQREYGYASS